MNKKVLKMNKLIHIAHCILSDDMLPETGVVYRRTTKQHSQHLGQ